MKTPMLAVIITTIAASLPDVVLAQTNVPPPLPVRPLARVPLTNAVPSPAVPRPAGPGSSFTERLQNIILRASEPGGTSSRLGSTAAQTGTVLRKRYTELGSVGADGNATVTCAQMIDTRATNTVALGVAVEVVDKHKSGGASTAYLDYDEIEPLIKGIETLGQADTPAAPFQRCEGIYNTRGNLRLVVVHTASGKAEATISSGREPAATARLTAKDLEKFKSLLQQALTQLQPLRDQKPN